MKRKGQQDNLALTEKIEGKRGEALAVKYMGVVADGR